MFDKRETKYHERPVMTAEERRRWERYPSAHDEVTVTSGSAQHSAVVVNASATGMGLALAEAAGLAEGQVVTIDGLSGPVRAVIRHTTVGDEGAVYVGVEWCE